MPFLSRANPELLSCPTWFVVEHPDTRAIVGCGGWTAHAPQLGASRSDSGSHGDNKEGDVTTTAAAASVVVRPHLRHFAVDPAFARSGIGTALWRCVRHSLSRELGPDLDLEVYSTITAAPFYESCGFVKVSEADVHFSMNCPFRCWLMTLQSRPDQGIGC
jgi:ribosomal protein S18 acetylase RimI-like enzyme